MAVLQTSMEESDQPITACNLQQKLYVACGKSMMTALKVACLYLFFACAQKSLQVAWNVMVSGTVHFHHL